VSRAWSTAPTSFLADRQNARGLRARGAVALLGGLRARRRAIVASKREKPLDLFGRAIAGASGDELLEMWLRIMEEAANRLDNYAAAIEDEAPPEVGNEAAVFARRAHDLSPCFASSSERAKKVHRDIYDTEKYILGLIEGGVVVDAS